MCPAKGPCRRRSIVHERLKNVCTKSFPPDSGSLRRLWWAFQGEALRTSKRYGVRRVEPSGRGSDTLNKDEDAMLLTLHPAFSLSPIVDCIWHCEGAAVVRGREHVLPDGRFQIVFNLQPWLAQARVGAEAREHASAGSLCYFEPRTEGRSGLSGNSVVYRRTMLAAVASARIRIWSRFPAVS